MQGLAMGEKQSSLSGQVPGTRERSQSSAVLPGVPVSCVRSGSAVPAARWPPILEPTWLLVTGNEAMTVTDTVFSPDEGNPLI